MKKKKPVKKIAEDVRTDQALFDLIEQSREEIRAGRTISLEEMKQSLLD
jgi:hypothetical protein